MHLQSDNVWVRSLLIGKSLRSIEILEFTSSPDAIMGEAWSMHARAAAVPVGISLCPSSSSFEPISQLSQAKDDGSGALGLKPGTSNAPARSHTSVFAHC